MQRHADTIVTQAKTSLAFDMQTITRVTEKKTNKMLFRFIITDIDMRTGYRHLLPLFGMWIVDVIYIFHVQLIALY